MFLMALLRSSVCSMPALANSSFLNVMLAVASADEASETSM